MAVFFIILVIVFIGIIVYNWYIKVGQFTEKERELLQEGASCHNCLYYGKGWGGMGGYWNGCKLRPEGSRGSVEKVNRGICENYEKE